METTDELIFFVNGQKIAVKNVEPETTLVAFLRRDLGLVGTKQSCNEGSCGACTVMLSSWDSQTGKIRHRAVTACMLPICALHGMAVTTIEGLGSLKTGLHPLQERIVKFHGTQCGFCTPGMVMTMYTLLRNNPTPTKQEIMDNLNGNICRCTGYRPIIDAFETFAEGTSESPSGSTSGNTNAQNCCAGTSAGTCCQATPAGNCCQGTPAGQVTTEVLTDVKTLSPYDPTQEPIFPPELQIGGGISEKLLTVKGRYVTWYKPASLYQALQIKKDNPTAQIAAGCNTLAQLLKGALEKLVVIDISGLKELKGHELKDDFLCLGTGLSMTDVIMLAAQETYRDAKVLQAVPKALESWGTQLRNSTLGGHIMPRKPVYDLIPLLVAGGCSVVFASKGSRRAVPLDEAFFRLASPIRDEEILVSLQIPCCRKNQQVETFKVATRRHQSFPSLSAAFVLDVSSGTTLKIEKSRVVFGGEIPSLFCPKQTESFLTDRIITDSTIKEANEVLSSELPPLDLSGFSQTQVTWAQGFLSKCLHRLMTKTDSSVSPIKSVFKSSQIFEISKDGSFSEMRFIGQPFTHTTGEEQATGEAVFIDDMSPTADELFVYPVLSTRAHAKVTAMDMTKALSMTGVRGYVDDKDIPGVNFVVPSAADEEVLTTGTVHHVGQMICGIVAKDRETAMRAAKCVEVSYEDQQRLILNIREAIAAKSFLATPRTVHRGDPNSRFAECDHVLEGEVTAKGQKHIYLEMFSVLAVPKERNEMEVHCNTQMPFWLQTGVAEVLGTPAHNITVKVKRIGGGFGGKEFRVSTAAALAAVSANKFNRPVRCIIDCKDDTTMNGGRHPILAKYKVGFTKEGRLLAIEMKMYMEGGMSCDTTALLLGITVLCGPTFYNVHDFHMETHGCRTNWSSNGAFRGFGVPQICWAMENVIIHVAAHLSVQPEKIRDLQLLEKGDVTVANSPVEEATLRQCWEQCKVMANYEKRLETVNEFNRVNDKKKRGIAVMPVIYPIGIYLKFLNQGGALVNVYTDGSVMVTHGGCEMGQGLHTKMKQIASETLGISYDKILLSETSTKLVPNATVSAGSVSTDLNGGAVRNACLTLLERLKPFREANPTGGWEKWVFAAYEDRVSLSSTGFYKFGNFGYDFETGKGADAEYFTCGAACSEVEIDCLSGEHKLNRTDIVMDVGRSINPAVDIGQIEGGFLQGYGYYMMEDVLRSDDGQLLTQSPISYKVPLASDLPAEFNVALLKGSTVNKGIYSSKGIGEPPMLLSLSAYLAAHKAVEAARLDRGLVGPFKVEHPATPANILKACGK